MNGIDSVPNTFLLWWIVLINPCILGVVGIGSAVAMEIWLICGYHYRIKLATLNYTNGNYTRMLWVSQDC